jgi:hypothetical protein
MMSKFIHIIPIGLEKDRNIYLLKKFPPFRVYFLEYKNNSKEEQKYAKLMGEIKKELSSLVTLAEKKYMNVSYENFEESFLTIFEIMVKEKKEGNEVIAHVISGPRLTSFAAWIAASITNSKAYYIRPAQYLPEGEKLISKGFLKEIELFRFPVTIPGRTGLKVLEYLLDNHQSMTGSLRYFVEKLDMIKLGSPIKSKNSAIVKMSYCLRELKRDQYVNISRVSKKRQKVVLTDIGRLVAKAYKVLKKYELNVNLNGNEETSKLHV